MGWTFGRMAKTISFKEVIKHFVQKMVPKTGKEDDEDQWNTIPSQRRSHGVHPEGERSGQIWHTGGETYEEGVRQGMSQALGSCRPLMQVAGGPEPWRCRPLQRQ